MNSPFERISASASGHLSLLLNYAAFRIAGTVRQRAAAQGKASADIFREFPFLAHYLAQIQPYLPADLDWSGAFAWLEHAIAEWEEQVPSVLPLRSARTQLHLDIGGLLAFLLIGIVDEDSQFGDLYAAMQPASGSRRPTVAMLREMLQPTLGPSADSWTVCRQLLETGLVEVPNEDAPRADWVLRVPSLTWSAARGDGPNRVAGITFEPRESLTPLADLVLPEPERRRLEAVPPLLATGRARTLVIRGTPGCDSFAVAGAVARELDRNVLMLQRAAPAGDPLMRQSGAVAALTNSLLVFCLDLAAGETHELPPPLSWDGPVAVLMGTEGGISGQLAQHAITVALKPDAVDERCVHWRRALNGAAAQDVREIAERFALPGRYIRQSARLAVSYAGMSGRPHVSFDDIRLANRAINRQVLDSLAERLETSGQWGHLVVPDLTNQEMAALERRCRYRESLSATLAGAIPGGLNRGVRALFEGPSGTGKTLAARILAAQLGLDIYRIDLASVVSKYIGETEKNLSRILSRAEDLDVILLLDEGDALMSKRTDVKSSNDRYANLETNYLLQRLENYAGIVIITTNFGQHIDSAFRRRLDAVLKFPLPDAVARLQLWNLHLSSDHAVSSQDLEQISIRYNLSGAQIRNSAVNALMCAMSRGNRPVRLEDVIDSVRTEYRKAGAAMPAEFGTPVETVATNNGSILGSIF